MKAGRLGTMAWLAGVALPLVAEPLSLDRGVFSAGGGLATANGFSATGTIGQPVAHTLMANAVTYFSFAGFWSQLLRWVNAAPMPGTDLVERRAGQGAHVRVAELLGNDFDGDWDALHLVSVDIVSTGGGSVFRDGAWVVYVPAEGADPEADDSFQYQVSDGYGEPVLGTVQVRVAGPPQTAAVALQIRLIAGPPDRVEVRFQGIAGWAYLVQTAPAASGPWAAVGTISASASGELNFVETPVSESRFFRILEP